MWFRVILTAFALALVLYLQFGFDIKDWIQESAEKAGEVSEANPMAESSPQP